ncbi:hypothetical protein AYI70_g1369 [Smittium culicis]|uniref:Uncharacterized protein n=1 Tax=Smittium culicis TaxID=133412 RepID=A0A1R1YCV4_9FUNG|nr:hypothetical protein AYI70_g1369 [Smittium culicis]
MRSKKRKVVAVEQQKVMSYGVMNQRCFFKAQGPLDTSIEIIVSNHRAVKRRSMYNSKQQNFLDWNLNDNQSEEILASHVVNHLAHLFRFRKLSVNTIKSYKPTIFNLVPESRAMENSPCIKKFLETI